MRIGLPTLFMVIPSKCISDAEPGVEAGQVLILTPFVVPVMVQSLTKIPDTGSSAFHFPRLPTLMPWPGPQVTPWMITFLLPSPRETQSSPVLMFELRILTPFDRPMWIPSVFKLVSGAETVKRWKVMFWHPRTLTWNCLLFGSYVLYHGVLYKIEP